MSESDDGVNSLLMHLDELIAGIGLRLPLALERWDVQATHQCRVSTRRLNAALELLKPILSKRPRKTLGRTLRKIRRRLGPLRDADVLLEHLREAGEQPTHALAAGWLSQRLIEKRDGLRNRSAKKSAASAVAEKLAAWRSVRAEIAFTGGAVQTLMAESVHLQLDAFAEQSDRLAQASADPNSSAACALDPHAIRIAGKALRYSLEMAVADGHKLPASPGKTFKKMQDALGLWHDHIVLADTAMRELLDATLSHQQPALAGEVLGLARESLAKATHNLDSFKALWAEKGQILLDSVRADFPLTRSESQGALPVEAQHTPDAIERKMGLDPADLSEPAAAEEDPQASTSSE